MDAILKIEAMPQLPDSAGFALVQGFGGTEDRLLSSTYDANSATHSVNQMHAYAREYAAQALASKDAEIARLRAALDKYRGQIDHYGNNSAGNALTPQPTE